VILIIYPVRSVKTDVRKLKDVVLLMKET